MKKKNNQNKGIWSISFPIIYIIIAFLFGFLFSTTIFLSSNIASSASTLPQYPSTLLQQRNDITTSSSTSSTYHILAGKRILVAIASFDLSQVPHLEEVLDGYRDMCEAGASVHVVIHSTVPYPVPFIDLLNSRLTCTTPSNLSITISLRSPKLRLHLADVHRTLFYEHIDEYDVFVYSEDDIRVRPTTVSAYLQEIERIIALIGLEQSTNVNVGIVRYEYNFPPDVIIDDKTRHATKNVTRVYWEHVSKPIYPKAVKEVIHEKLKPYYVSMGNHHQGMYIATQHLLKAWTREGCNFDVIRDRPGKGSQPTEGTQRVWMSSHMLYGSRHCNVNQVLPMNHFGAFNVLHLPNKNYRRVGKKGRIGAQEGAPENKFSDGTETFVGPDPSLLSAMQLHKAIIQNLRPQYKGNIDYNGIVMIDEIEDGTFRNYVEHMDNVRNVMKRYQDYVDRGGVLLESDFEL